MGNLIKSALRLISVLFTGGMGLAQIALGLITSISGDHNLKLDMYPYQGKELTNFLLALGAGSLLGAVGGVRGGIFRFLLPVATMLQSYFLVNGQVLGPHPFGDLLDANTSATLAGTSVLAVIGSLLVLLRRKK